MVLWDAVYPYHFKMYPVSTVAHLAEKVVIRTFAFKVSVLLGKVRVLGYRVRFDLEFRLRGTQSSS